MNGNELILLRRIEDLENYIKRVPEVGGVWKNWTPTVTGWAAGYTMTSRYTAIGKLAHIVLDISGTSNATSAQATLPLDVSASGGYLYFQMPNFTNNGTTVLTGGRAYAQIRPTGVVNENEVWFWLDGSQTGWTASGTKRVRVLIWYEIA